MLEDIVQRIEPFTGFQGFELGGISWSGISHSRPKPSFCMALSLLGNKPF
jgi:hypothetical protein